MTKPITPKQKPFNEHKNDYFLKHNIYKPDDAKNFSLLSFVLRTFYER